MTFRHSLVLLLTGLAAALAVLASPAFLPTLARPADAMTFNPDAQLDTSHVDDLRAEAIDVLMLTYANSAPDLWNALGNTHPEWYDEGPADAPGEGTFYVPVNAAISVDGAAYTATYDGWLRCSVEWAACRSVTFAGDDIVVQDTAAAVAAPADPAASLTPAQRARYGTTDYAVCGTDAQCAAYSREVLHEAPSGYAAQHFASVPRTHVTLSKGEAKAARAIANRIRSHRGMFEDWTWRGAPRYVGQHNDALIDAWQAAGSPRDVARWLDRVARTAR